jgi:hypothetical protein
MLGLLLDGAIICGIVMLINQDETPDFWPAVGCALVTAIIGAVAFYGVGIPTESDLMGGLVAAVVMGITVAISLMLVFSSTAGRASIGGVIFTGYKIGFSVLMAVVFAV